MTPSFTSALIVHWRGGCCKEDATAPPRSRLVVRAAAGDVALVGIVLALSTNVAASLVPQEWAKQRVGTPVRVGVYTTNQTVAYLVAKTGFW